MSIQGNIAPRIIQSISSLYSDSNRVLLEFIDNSIDSAEQYFDIKTQKYKKPILINLEISGSSHKDGEIIISDNCEGISNLQKIVQSFGNSRKRGHAETNGQFGFGMCSFLASCAELEIVTKLENEKVERIAILKDHFDVDEHKDFLFSDVETKDSFPTDSGTIITLNNFDRASWKSVDIDFIKTEIEKHFELLLKRENLQIKLVNSSRELICKPFDYIQYEGGFLEKQIEIDNSQIKSCIKITKGQDIKKRSVFIIKGRRINEVSEIKSFQSTYKSDIWNHPNVTGYIDLGSYIEPDISRTGFAAKQKDKEASIFDFLISMESDILDLIKEGNEESQEKHYQNLEDILSKALSKLAKFDSMNYRTEYINGNDIPLDQNKDGNNGIIDNSDSNNLNKTSDHVNEQEDHNKKNDSPFNDNDNRGSEKKKSGFNIKISDLEPNIDAETGKQIKSRLLGSTIEIFRKHPDFESRLEHFRGGELKISQRLVTYLAGEITVHYKDKYYMKSGQPEYNKKMFESLVDSIYLFEELLKKAVGKNLSSWNE